MRIAAFVDLNRILHHAKRFTDDIFSGLTSAIFIVNALGSPTSTESVFHYIDAWHPSHNDFRDDDEYSFLATALVSLLLCLGTNYLSLQLRAVKASPFLSGPRSRAVVGDFAVDASVIVRSPQRHRYQECRPVCSRTYPARRVPPALARPRPLRFAQPALAHRLRLVQVIGAGRAAGL